MKNTMLVTPEEYSWILKLREKCTTDTGFNDAEWVCSLQRRFGCLPYRTYDLKVVNRSSDYSMPEIIRFGRSI